MNEQDRIKLYNKLWVECGSSKQLDVLIEEMAELTQAILKARRCNIVFSRNVYEEIADVCICMEQVKTRLKSLPMDFEESEINNCNIWDDLVMRIKKEKLNRLGMLVANV